MTRLMPLLLLLPACEQVSVVASGDFTTDDRDTSYFDSLRNRSSIRVEAELDASAQQVEVFCHDNVVDHIGTEVQGDELVISIDNINVVGSLSDCEVRVRTDFLLSVIGEGSGDTHTKGDLVGLDTLRNRGSGKVDAKGIQTQTVVEISLEGSGNISTSVKAADALDVFHEGSGKLDVGRVDCPLIEIDHTGSGDLELKDIDADEVIASTGGSGDAALEGVAPLLDLTLSGSGAIDGKDLVGQQAQVLNEGSGKLSVRAEASVEGALRGSGDIDVHGDPTSIDIDVTGSGRVDVK